jgi:hypothetical protein
MRFLGKHFACEKNLRRLEREVKRLWQVRRDTPLVALEQPYQRGWFKTYVLDAQARIARTPQCSGRCCAR